MQRSRTFASLVLVVGLLTGLASSVALAPEARALASMTVLSRANGDVLVRHAGDDFAPAVEGEVMVAGDTIRTGPASVAEVTYFEGSSVRLEADTEITVQSLATKADGSTVIAMWQTLGRTWHVVTKLLTGGSRYEVRTPSSTASVRGTIFAVDVDAEASSSTITTTEGAVVQIASDPVTGAGAAVWVRAGERSTKVKGKPAEAAQPAAPSTLRDAPSRPSKSRSKQGSAPAVVTSSEVRVETRDDSRAAKVDRAGGLKERAKPEAVTTRPSR